MFVSFAVVGVVVVVASEHEVEFRDALSEEFIVWYSHMGECDDHIAFMFFSK